jgi:hypothetical protein
MRSGAWNTYMQILPLLLYCFLQPFFAYPTTVIYVNFLFYNQQFYAFIAGLLKINGQTYIFGVI